jgi:hypothetical protein
MLKMGYILPLVVSNQLYLFVKVLKFVFILRSTRNRQMMIGAMYIRVDKFKRDKKLLARIRVSTCWSEGTITNKLTWLEVQ